MDAAGFLKRLQDAAVKLVPVTIEGWDEPIYLRPPTLASMKEQVARSDPDGTLAERIGKDPLYLERKLARILRNEHGALLFDEKDEAQLIALRDALKDARLEIFHHIQEADNRLSEPDKGAIDKEGN